MAAAICGFDVNCAIGMVRNRRYMVLGYILMEKLIELADGLSLRHE